MKVLLIGGSPCSGKSSVAAFLSEKYGYQHIRTDDFMGNHIDESIEGIHRTLYRWKTEPWHELFSRDVRTQLEDQINFYMESWDFLVRDIKGSIHTDKIVVEGCGLVPSKVSSLFHDASVIYMVPTEEFQLTKYKERQWAFDILKDAADVQLAFDRWMKRDIEFSKHILKEAVNNGYDVHITKGSKSIQETADFIMDKFQL